MPLKTADSKQAERFPPKAVLKIFLAIFLPLEFILAIFFLVFYVRDMRMDHALLAKSDAAHVELQKWIITYDFKKIIKDLLFMADSQTLKEYLDLGGDLRRQTVAQAFLRFCARQEDFDQVRYLDDSGMEVIRVNFNDGQPAIVPEAQLQSKAKRYFFLDSIRLARGGVFVSPFDLNIEGQEIERPFKPTIRFATPVFDSQGRKRGILIFNYLGNEIFENLQQAEANANAPGRLMLLNAEGYWLYSPNHGDAWGFMFADKKNLTFGAAHPEAWKIISTSERGQFQDAGGLFTFATVYPLRDGLKSSAGTYEAEGESAKTLETWEYKWKVVSFIAPGIWRERSHYLVSRLSLLFGFLTILFTALSWVLARARLNRLQGEGANIRLASIVESSADAIIGKTLEGTILSWNHGAEQIYGYTAAEMAGQNISVLIPPDHLDELTTIFKKIGQGEKVQNFETIRRRKDGRIINVSLTISATRDSAGNIVGISTIARDISERKQAEVQLRQLSRAVEQSPATVVITDAQGSIQYVNPKFTMITGYTAEEALGQNPRILKSGEATTEEYKELWDTILSGKEWRGLFHNKKKNGELYWESASISPIKDAHGVITNFVAVKEDITAMKAAQDELSKLSLVASKTDNGVIITDRDGFIEWVNDGFTRMTGYTLPEVAGKKPGPILQGPKTDPETISRIRTNMQKKEPFAEEILNYHKNGQPYWVSMDITPIQNDRGDLVRFISIQRDITRSKETEEALYQAKKAADAANIAKSEFLASMSHEIRTPMNAIIGMADLLSETPLSQEQQQYVEVFHSAGETLLNLINDILDLSKVEAGQITLESIDLDLAEIVEKVCEVMAFKAHQKGLELACRITPRVPTRLMGDPVRLRQILTNLVGNAIKFTEAGEVVVEAKIASEAQCPADLAVPCQITFSIKDMGIGISPEKLEVIFEKFTQADTSTTRKYGGSGLGLAISKHLVELMGGDLQVQSQVGQGSTFGFTIPFSRQLEPQEKPSIPAADLKDLRVLVVDDNATNRLILREIMTGWGARVGEAENGIQGLAELERAKNLGQPYQLVLLDGRMPHMDGFGMAAAIHDDAGFSGMTVMMLTSDARSGDLSRARDLGLASYLVKPVKRHDLKEAIDRALHRALRDTSATPSSAAIAPEEQRPLRILLADDSADNRLLIQAYLKKYPFQIDIAEDGEQALGKFQAGSYDLVLMDMQMPVLDGYDATRRIREWERQQQVPPTPVIALTAYALKEEIQKSLDAGCTVHLTKPIKKSVLLEAIAQYSRNSERE